MSKRLRLEPYGEGFAVFDNDGDADDGPLFVCPTLREAEREMKLREAQIETSERFAKIEKRLDAVSPEEAERRARAAVRSAFGKKSGEVRANKPWHVHARMIVASAKPPRRPAQLARDIEKSLDDKKIPHPDLLRIERWLKGKWPPK
jgi:hypothetical protein